MRILRIPRVCQLSKLCAISQRLRSAIKSPCQHSKYVITTSPQVKTMQFNINAQVLVIGCGSYQPIKTYAAQSASKYPIYTDPTLRLHEILNFKYSFSTGEKGDEQRDYMRDAGSVMARVWSGVKMAVGRLDHVNYVGPKSLNGGEVVISAGKLSYHVSGDMRADILQTANANTATACKTPSTTRTSPNSQPYSAHKLFPPMRRRNHSMTADVKNLAP
jgi:hypothetical protein